MAQPNLFIPHKEMDPVDQPGYGHDMREIEMWSQTLSAGANVGAFDFQMTGPSQLSGTVVAWSSGNASGTGTVTPQLLMPIAGGNPGYPLAQFVTSTIVTGVIGSGGFVYLPTSIGTGKTIWGNAHISAPQFTGPSSTVSVFFTTQAVSMDGVSPANDSFAVTSHTIALTSGAGHSFAAGDYGPNVITGADLQFTLGALSLKSTAANKPYLVGWSVLATWDTANTYAGTN